MTGRGGVPSTGVGAVVLNVTVTNPATGGYTTVFPSGPKPPNSSTVNFSSRSTVPNAIISGVSSTGSVSVFNSTAADVIIDVSGWLAADGAYTGIEPVRLTDTRAGRVTVDGQEQAEGAFWGARPVQVTGRAGIPSTGVSAVVLNLTVTGAVGDGYSTVYPSGVTRPPTSSLNFVKAGTRANLVIVNVGASGSVELFNSVGSDAIVDVLGWFPTGSDYSPLVPSRLVDTRQGRPTSDGREAGGGAFAGTDSFPVAGRAGVPADAGAVILNVTVTGSGTGGYTTEFPAGERLPRASNLNYSKGQSVANLVVARVGIDGHVNVFNNGPAHVIIDVFGWLPKAPAGPSDSAGTTRSIAVSLDGTIGKDASGFSSPSGNGRYVTFGSEASTLVAGDTNNAGDVFLYDRYTVSITRISIGPGGVQGNDGSFSSSVSDDGRYVAYLSAASNLVVGDTNGKSDVFVYDRVSGETTRVSVDSSGGQANESSGEPSISADGAFIAFESTASNLVAGDTNGQRDIFVHDRDSGVTSRVSLADDGGQADGESVKSSISAGGTKVVFESAASNLVTADTNGKSDVFVRDLVGATTTRVSVADDGRQADGVSGAPTINGDGRYIAFHSTATNLVPEDTNGTQDVFLYDSELGVATRVSSAPDGSDPDGISSDPEISADGSSIAYRSDATDLVAGGTGPNRGYHIFVYDRGTATTTLVSPASEATESLDFSFQVGINADGSVITYTYFETAAMVGGGDFYSQVHVWARRD
ncbi:MAG: hypothetical protein WBF71_06645 [Microthrixaceae bacterium]